MKRLIFFVMVLCSSVFSADMQISKEDMVWRTTITAGIHGVNKAAWTERVKMPEQCKVGMEAKLSNIVTISLNVLNKKPEDWLQGKYLQYVNENCDLFGFASVTPEVFERIVNNHFKDLKKDNGLNVKEMPIYIMLGALSFVPLLVTLFFSKSILLYIKRTWFS